MKTHKTSQYFRTQKKLLKKHALSQRHIDTTLELFSINSSDPSLQFKKMTCKKDKNRYSIRVQNTQYRVLINLLDNEAYLVCICDHDEYDRRNKDC